MPNPPSAVPTLVHSTAVNANDHSLQVFVAALLCLTFSTLFFLTRLYIRWPWKSLVGRDDVFAAIAFAFSIVQTAVILRAKDDGLGRRTNQLQQASIASTQRLLYASELLLIVTLAFSKAAVCALLQRFSGTSTQTTFVKTLLIASGIYGVAGVLIVALRDDLIQPWVPQSSSSNATLARWIACTTIGNLIDIATMLFPIYLVWNLQMARESKRKIIIGFLMRAPVVALSIARVVAISHIKYDDYIFSYTVVEIWTQLELHYSVAPATMPCLHVSLKGWNTRFLGTTLEDVDQSAHHETGTTISEGGPYPMNTVQGSKERGKQSRGFHSTSLQGKHRGISQTTAHYGQAADEDAVSDSSRKAIVVKRTYDVDIR